MRAQEEPREIDASGPGGSLPADMAGGRGTAVSPHGDRQHRSRGRGGGRHRRSPSRPAYQGQAAAPKRLRAANFSIGIMQNVAFIFLVLYSLVSLFMYAMYIHLHTVSLSPAALHPKPERYRLT